MSVTEAARLYLAKGWVPIALGPDVEGRPKRPIAQGWQTLTVNNERVYRQGWNRAVGVGVALGPQSGNLAVIDIDDQDLAAAVFAKFVRSGQPFRWAWTGRNRGHLYLREKYPSEPRFMTVRWEGRVVKCELKAKGQQVAAPCTPGYTLARECEPQEVENIGAAWAALCLAFGLEPESAESKAGYPKAWLEHVPEGERNRALYVEAARLAEARMPYVQAVDLLALRYEKRYAGSGADPRELRQTIQSAYRRIWREEGTEVQGVLNW